LWNNSLRSPAEVWRRSIPTALVQRRTDQSLVSHHSCGRKDLGGPDLAQPRCVSMKCVENHAEEDVTVVPQHRPRKTQTASHQQRAPGAGSGAAPRTCSRRLPLEHAKQCRSRHCTRSRQVNRSERQTGVTHAVAPSDQLLGDATPAEGEATLWLQRATICSFDAISGAVGQKEILAAAAPSSTASWWRRHSARARVCQLSAIAGAALTPGSTAQPPFS
jgi:hypothetical protein